MLKLRPTNWNQPTNFKLAYQSKFDPAYQNTHIFYCSAKMKTGVQMVDYKADNGYHVLYKKALNFIKQSINAVDIGCRDGEFTRYLTWKFKHVYCFDYRKRIQFPMNIDITKNNVTHYTCALGEQMATEYASGRGNFRSVEVDPRWINQQRKIYTLDQFNLSDINLIKVDVDGMDEEVLRGAEQTISKCEPIIIVEEIESQGIKNHDAVGYLTKLGYKVAYVDQKTNSIHKDYIMVPKHYNIA